MFINSEHKISSQDEIIEKLRLEIVHLTSTRDKLILWNDELVRWSLEISNKKEQIKQDLYTLESTLEETRKILEKQQKDFTFLTGEQRKNIEQFNVSIQARLAELKKQEWKELIDFDEENRKIKALLQIARKDLVETENDIRVMREERIAFATYRESELQRLENETNYNESKRVQNKLKEEQLIEANRQLAMREQTIKIREQKVADIEKQIESFKIS